MGKLLCIGTYATDDPTRATMPFIAAAGALERGHKPKIVLMGEAVYLLKKGVADTVHGVGFPPLKEFIDSMVENEVPFYLWMPCSVARGVTEEDFQGIDAKFAGPPDLADLMMEADSTVSF